MLIKLTWKRIVIYCLILAAIFAIIAAVAAAATAVITAEILDTQWQQYETAMLNYQRKETVRAFELALRYQQELRDIQEAKHRIALGKQRLYWLEKFWTIYYNSCNLFTRNQFSSCLESARKGYIEGRHDNVKPAPYWDWDYVQFGKYLESG